MRTHPYNEQEQLAMTLSMQTWIDHFQQGQWKWMVCNALNYLIGKEEMEVVGYWLNERKLFLILNDQAEELPGVLRDITRALREEIERAWAYQQTLKGLKEEYSRYFESYSLHGDDVFTYHQLTNTSLIGLLLGQDVKPLYTDVSVQKLKNALKADGFNSYQVYRFGSTSVVELV
jgi:hypothetical protein